MHAPLPDLKHRSPRSRKTLPPVWAYFVCLQSDAGMCLLHCLSYPSYFKEEVSIFSLGAPLLILHYPCLSCSCQCFYLSFSKWRAFGFLSQHKKKKTGFLEEIFNKTWNCLWLLELSTYTLKTHLSNSHYGFYPLQFVFRSSSSFSFQRWPSV
jgi:hypothetical protein